jgi:hypothetical protein
MNMRSWQNRRTARTDRWKREDDAPRLKQEVPNLEALRMNLEEFSGGHRIMGTSRIQHVVVGQASTRFEIPCGDSKCEDGGHDLTRDMLNALRSGREAFNASSVCSGRVGERACDRALEYSFTAKYQS